MEATQTSENVDAKVSLNRVGERYKRFLRREGNEENGSLAEL
ncbi:hypothetical protein Halxa_2918 [Halopiger xanaduensis SH-6]|uniref:Uncharacterized protein n=1 Tax=Halopiger xanaduensis (strain DSM 18323 / JCM 14033 / SH-6) TaxID=797210 RepID=F8D4R5_HALXS|nr:hypothetical protein Halxa_2918 [Halopiger xanaduensis SH-6]